MAPSGDVTGFSVALPGDRNRDGKPIWFSGSKLAPDLSLPRIRQRLAADATPPSEGTTEPARARRAATTAAADVLRSLAQDDDESAADHLIGIGEVLDALAQTSPATTRTELQAAARTFERATRSHIQASNAHNQVLRKAARDLIQSGPALGKGEDGAAAAMLLSILITAAVMAAHWHAARGHAQQAAAARQTATDLRAAYEAAASTPLTTMRATGQTLPASAQQHAAEVIRAVLPTEAACIQAEPHWPALAATLTEAAQAGHDPVTLLHRAVDNRELTTADSLTDVLLWCLRHEANLPAAPKYAPQQQRPTPTPHPVPQIPPPPARVPSRRR
ncbi:hypothetical protein [Streptomyces sp. NPDC008139]|uniref:hypothetical protein n=1 Tax=Streptomyces sp. NPDC008139 TaxID=3364814 RepID=UPI0036E262CD